jgi:GT2 family glycosyltransferase
MTLENLVTAVRPGNRSPAADRLAQEQPLSVATPSGLASIVVPCCGQLEYTKLCVPSLLKHTRQPFELIFLDIGSLDGTAEYLAGLAAAAPIRVEMVRTATDLGIGDAVQDALRLARGEFVVLLNNDALVTDGWLNQLTGLAQMTPAIGLVGPMSNYAAPPQLVEKVPYRIVGSGRWAVGSGTTVGSGQGAVDSRQRGGGIVDVGAVDAFARQWREEHKGKWVEAERLGGFCLLIKREVLKRIGHLREAGDLALFDTDLLCQKARQAGFTLACCKDLFVHHFGTRTFAHGAPMLDGERSRGRDE